MAISPRFRHQRRFTAPLSGVLLMSGVLLVGTLIPAAPAAATGDSITSFTAGVGPSLNLGWSGAEGG